MTRKANEREEILRRIAETKMSTSLARYIQSGTSEGPPSRQALADRAKREKLPETRDLTGLYLGDPPNGRSALDQKRLAKKPEEETSKSIWNGIDLSELLRK
jgi:hypothetical protein